MSHIRLTADKFQVPIMRSEDNRLFRYDPHILTTDTFWREKVIDLLYRHGFHDWNNFEYFDEKEF